jgi:hypothetical protein
MKSNGDGVCNGGRHQNNLLKTCLESLFSLNFWAMGIPMEKNGDG